MRERQGVTMSCIHGHSPRQCQICELEGKLVEVNDLLRRWINYTDERKNKYDLEKLYANTIDFLTH